MTCEMSVKDIWIRSAEVDLQVIFSNNIWSQLQMFYN